MEIQQLSGEFEDFNLVSNVIAYLSSSEENWESEPSAGKASIAKSRKGEGVSTINLWPERETDSVKGEAHKLSRPYAILSMAKFASWSVEFESEMYVRARFSSSIEVCFMAGDDQRRIWALKV